MVATDAGGYAGVAHSLLTYASEECGRRPRVCMMRVSDEAETDLARASKTLDAAVALRELRLESDVVAPWREDISSIVALAARPLRGRCGAVLDLETWARFVRGPGAGSAGVVVDAAFGPEPEGPFSSVFFDGEKHARDAARRDGLRVVATLQRGRASSGRPPRRRRDAATRPAAARGSAPRGPARPSRRRGPRRARGGRLFRDTAAPRARHRARGPRRTRQGSFGPLAVADDVATDENCSPGQRATVGSASWPGGRPFGNQGRPGALSCRRPPGEPLRRPVAAGEPKNL